MSSLPSEVKQLYKTVWLKVSQLYVGRKFEPSCIVVPHKRQVMQNSFSLKIASKVAAILTTLSMDIIVQTLRKAAPKWLNTPEWPTAFKIPYF